MYPRETIKGVVILKDKNGKECTTEGIAELSCPFFTKQFRIQLSDFEITTFPDGRKKYAYRIEFKRTMLKGERSPFARPYATVQFKLRDLVATCELKPYESRGKPTKWQLMMGDKVIDEGTIGK